MDSNFKLLVGTKVEDTIQSQLNKFPKKTITVTPILDKKGFQTGTKEITSYTDSMGKAYTTTKTFNNATKETDTVLTKAKETVGGVGKSLSDTSKHADTLGSKFLDITKKVIAFGGVTAIIGLFTKTISEAYQAVKNMDDVMTEFNKVSDMSGESLSKYTDELTEMGESVARTGAEMLASSTEFVKAGYDEKQSAELAKVANLYMNIADSQVSSAEASALLVSQMKAFNMTADEATVVIDQINEVSNLFAVSSTDISTALTKSSSALATYGNTMSESISLVTAGSEIMTGQASKVSKG